MEVIYSRCCGLDVHAKTVVACLCIQGEKQIRTFTTMTAGLLQLSDWLALAGCTHVAIESTGVYWRPVFNILEGNFEVLLVNAHHIKSVPGRKTDVRDCEWICDLLRHGLLKASFIPPRPIREFVTIEIPSTSVQRETTTGCSSLHAAAISAGRMRTICWHRRFTSAAWKCWSAVRTSFSLTARRRSSMKTIAQ